MADKRKGDKARDAKPGEPISLAERREREKKAEKKSDPLEESNGKSAEERAEEAAEDEEADGQFAFVTEDSANRITFGTFIPRNTPVEYKVTMGSKSNILRGGLLDPKDTNHLLLVRGIVSEGRVAFTHDENETITKATVYITLAPRTVINAKTEQAEVMLHGEPPSAASK